MHVINAIEMKKIMDRKRKCREMEDKKKMRERWEKTTTTSRERDIEELGVEIADLGREIADVKKIFKDLNIK